MSRQSYIQDEIQRILYFQTRPNEWAIKYMGVRRETIYWSENPGYKNHEWDGDVDPLAQMAQAIADWHKRIAVKSGVGTGKTFDLGWIPLWWLDCFRPSQVITLAPKEDQLTMNLWKEIGRFWPKFEKLHPQAKMMNLQIRMRPEGDDKMSWGMMGFVAGVGAEESTAVRAHGFHAEHMLILAEEGPGMNRAVVKAFKNTAVAPHNIFMMVGNPDADHDPLSEFARSRNCYNIRISALDHPNLVLNNPSFVSGACTHESVQDIFWDEASGDETHPMYESRVRGLTPTVSSRSLFSSRALKGAKDHLIEPEKVIYHDDEERGVEGVTHTLRKPKFDFLNRYVLFMDVAGDDVAGDWHAATLWDRVDRNVAAVVHMRGLGVDYVKACLHLVKMYSISGNDNIYARPVMCWETNGVGAHFHNISPELRAYPNLYWRRNIEAAGARPRRVYGWHSSGREGGSKDKLIQELKGFNRELMYYPEKLGSKLIYEECKTFTLQSSGSGSKYKAAEGYYDDLVISLGGALLIDRVTDPPLPIEIKEDEPSKVMSERYRRVMELNKKSDDPFDIPFAQLAGI